MRAIKEKIRGFFKQAADKKAQAEVMITDSRGRLCPVGLFSKVQLARDALVKYEIQVAQNRAIELSEYQQHLTRVICDFYAQSAAESGENISLDAKQGLSISSLDGLMRIKLVVAKTKSVNEKLPIAKKLLDDMIERHGKDIESFFKSMIFDSFEASASGQIRIDKIIELRSRQCGYKEWAAIKDALDHAIESDFKKRYLIFQMREDTSDSWKQIPLNLSKN